MTEEINQINETDNEVVDLDTVSEVFSEAEFEQGKQYSEEMFAEDNCQTDKAEDVECDVEKNGVTLDEIMSSLGEMNEKIEHMNKLFVQKIQHTTHEEKIVDQMHAELQKYKDDMYSQLVRPILLDIIEIRDSIIRMSNSFAMKPEGEQDVPLKTFRDYSYDIQDVLEKNSITIYDSNEGDDFLALKQRVVKKVIAPVEALHGKIAESLSSGYDYMGKTISPEKVVVYVYEKPTDNTEGEQK